MLCKDTGLVGILPQQRIGLRARRIQLALARQHIEQQQVQLQAVWLRGQCRTRGGFRIVELVGVDGAIGAVGAKIGVRLQRRGRLCQRYAMTERPHCRGNRPAQTAQC
ncbi:Uncharacterised protein [Escherichia coli]|nr:Uncharacterised protein [Escherichia coli]